MPTYEYECQKCGKVFEVFQNMTAELLSDCQNTKCNGKVKRLLGTGAGFIFKGSGFYATDNRSKDYKKKEKEERPSQSPPQCQGCDKKSKGCQVDK